MLDPNLDLLQVQRTTNNMKNIDVNKFYKTMDQLMSDFSPPRVSTSFERKVGASLCKASELAMSDKLPKFSLVSAPTGDSKTTSSIALLAMLANEDKGFNGAFVFKTIEECEYVYRQLKRLVDPSELVVYTSLHKHEASPTKL